MKEMTLVHDHPSPIVYLAAIAAGAATTCWYIRREMYQVVACRSSVVAPEAEAALRRINLRLIRGGN